MPLTYRIDESVGLITLTLSGRITAADITDYTAASRADTPLGRAMIAMFFGHWGLANQYRLFDDVPSAMIWIQSGKPASE